MIQSRVALLVLLVLLGGCAYMGRQATITMGGHVLAEHTRMVFVKGTPPERAVRGLRRGARLHVFGLPRINVAEVLRRVEASATDPVQLTWSIPSEIVIAGAFPDDVNKP